MCGLIYCLLMSSPGLLRAADADLESEAQAAIAAFAGRLKAELVAALQAGGPVNAIEACHSRAPEIAASVSSATGMNLSRVSLRNRNPANAPNGWQAEVLQQFQQQAESGTDLNSMAWSEVADLDGGKEFRFMKAIPTGGLCLQCHGEAIAPPVAARISELYPDDRATGFMEGELRGAFVVTRPLEP